MAPLSRTPGVFVVLSAACCVAVPPSAGHTGASDTSSPQVAPCPPDVGAIPVAVCVETTAAQSSSATLPAVVDWDAAGTARITHVGGAVGRIDGSTPFGGFPGCGGVHVRQVRMVDGDGATWTVGWRVPGDDASIAALEVGASVAFTVRYRWEGHANERGVLLRDADGPLFLFETAGADFVSDAERGGIAARVEGSDVCATDGGAYVHRRVTFTGASGATTLRSGQRATVSSGRRELDVVLAGAYRDLGCPAGCDEAAWVAWAR